MAKAIRRRWPKTGSRRCSARRAACWSAARRLNGGVVQRRRNSMPDEGTVLTFTDVTALTERERALEENSTLLNALDLGESMDQGMLVLDAEMNIRIWNVRFAELIELPADFIRIGMPAADLVRFLGIRQGLSAEAGKRRSRSGSRNSARGTRACWAAPSWADAWSSVAVARCRMAKLRRHLHQRHRAHGA